MTKLNSEIRERTVQLSNEDLDKVSGGHYSVADVTVNKTTMASKSAAANDAYIRS